MAEGVCMDTKEQLANQCCYQQCLLCKVGIMSTNWYKAVAYEGLTTTCLGIDCVLRAQQVLDRSYWCTKL